MSISKSTTNYAFLSVLTALALTACSPANEEHPGFLQPADSLISVVKGNSESNVVGTTPSEVITFNKHIKPIFADKCVSCHDELATYSSSVALKSSIMQTVVVEKTMPTGISMSDQERSLVGQWIDAGALEDIPGKEVPAPPAAVVPVDFEKSKNAYEEECAGCHGDKVSNLAWPSLYGMNEKYFVKQMSDYRSKTRVDRKLRDGGMNSFVEEWSDELILGVAKYLKTRNTCEVQKSLDPRGGNIELGAKIAQESCMGCHGSNKSFPLDGQVTKYMAEQLAQYKTGERKHKTMQGLAEEMSDQEMLDVSAYFNSIRTCK